MPVASVCSGFGVAAIDCAAGYSSHRLGPHTAKVVIYAGNSGCRLFFYGKIRCLGDITTRLARQDTYSKIGLVVIRAIVHCTIIQPGLRAAVQVAMQPTESEAELFGALVFCGAIRFD